MQWAIGMSASWKSHFLHTDFAAYPAAYSAALRCMIQAQRAAAKTGPAGHQGRHQAQALPSPSPPCKGGSKGPYGLGGN